VIGWWIYAAMGRPNGKPKHSHGRQDHYHTPKPKWQSTFVGVTHCGGGCALGDSIAAPIVSALVFTVLGTELLAHFTGEFISAYLFGIAFQLLPMLEMGETSVAKAFINAIKADT